MEITTEHPEGQRVRGGIQVKKGLLFDRVTLQGTHVPPGNPEHATLIEADLANPPAPFADQASVSACVTAHSTIGESFIQLSFFG
jgi:hypothetical protein